MEMVITGHTSGIGKYIYEHYSGVGLSRATGFDITKDDISPYITTQTTFINNAWAYNDPWAQGRMLKQSLHAKKIICIGTNSQYHGVYTESKNVLKNTCHNLFCEGYDVTYLALGKVDTPFTDKYHPNDLVINKAYIIQCIEFILSSAYRIEILSVRPD